MNHFVNISAYNETLNSSFVEKLKTVKLLTQMLQNGTFTLADPGGRRPRPPPPNRINFFRFHIRFCQKVYASEVGTPPTGRRPPPPQREILDPPLI